MVYNEIKILLEKIGIDLDKVRIKKDIDKNIIDFNDISIDDEMKNNVSSNIMNKENIEYEKDEETLENIYFKLKEIYGDKKYIIRKESIIENNIKRVYKYIPISKIDIMVTNHSRNDRINDKLLDSMPLIEYIYSKEFKDFDRVRLEYILKDYNKEKYQEVEDLQKEFLQKEPFKITYEEDVFYEIYYLKNENRYILLICTEDIVFKEIQYLLQKKSRILYNKK